MGTQRLHGPQRYRSHHILPTFGNPNFQIPHVKIRIPRITIFLILHNLDDCVLDKHLMDGDAQGRVYGWVCFLLSLQGLVVGCLLCGRSS